MNPDWADKMNVSELAKRLNLSPSTVSRALSGQGSKNRVSKATVQRVCQAAEKYQVTPDPLGASLRRGKLGMIGVLVPDVTNSFFAELARCIELELREHDMTVQLCDSNEDAKAEAELLPQMLGRRLDGAIVAPVGMNSPGLRHVIETAAMPIVLIDRILPGLEVPTVSLDNSHAGRMAANHLLQNGHRRIGVLRGEGKSFTDQERHRGVIEALQEAGAEINPQWIAGCGYTQADSVQAAREILGTERRPDALIALSGQGILGVLEAVTEIGLSIPRDLSVIAFDEQPWSAYVNPPLTTIVQPTKAMAVAAVNVLLAEDAIDRNGVFQARVCQRQSVSDRRSD